MIRVHPITGKGIRGEEQWLVIEKPSEQHPADHYVLATLTKSMTRKLVIRRIKQRWRVERTYEDLKGELGLGHFEGGSYRGWQHHVTCAKACYAFLVAERASGEPNLGIRLLWRTPTAQFQLTTGVTSPMGTVGGPP